jgi:DNA-binding GntR family transcriptional regulator
MAARAVTTTANDSPALSGLTGTQRAVVALREGISTGRYIPGQRLVETDLVDELGVGRNSLREAFSRLASEGLVVVEPYRGASVRRRSRTEVGQLYDISEVLEGLAAREAAQNIDGPGNVELLMSCTERQSEAVAASAYEQIDEAASFHTAILRIADNPRLTELCTNLHILTFSFQLRHAQLAGTHPMSGHSLTEHREIADAIRSGDPAHAEEVMRRHLRNGKLRVMALPDNAFA